jgi:DNA-binding NtrC family response regulator
MDYPWPGNIRELRNIIERAVVLCPSDTISLDDLPEEVIESCGAEVANPIPSGQATPAVCFRGTRHQAELVLIAETLRRNMNNKLRAAAELGISRMTLYNKIHKYGLTS